MLNISVSIVFSVLFSLTSNGQDSLEQDDVIDFCAPITTWQHFNQSEVTYLYLRISAGHFSYKQTTVTFKPLPKEFKQRLG